MKATLKLNDGREIPVDVSEETLKLLEKPVKKTGYEKVSGRDRYYVISGINNIDENRHDSEYDDELYQAANYYSNKTVAENNARADRLYRQLRRFAVEHREHELDWKNSLRRKYYLFWDYSDSKIAVDSNVVLRDFGQIYFDSAEAAKAAIEKFRDELIWYFTEYKDSL